MRTVVLYWRTHWESFPGSSNDFDVAYVSKFARPALSEWSAHSSIKWRRDWYKLARVCRNRVWVVCVYAFLMLLVTRRRARKSFLAAFVILVFAGCAFFNRSYVAGFVWPGDLHYLNDYVYVTGLDWETDKDKNGILISYEKQPWNGERRIVAYMDGKLDNLKEDEFRALAAEQGIHVPGLDTTPPGP